MRVFSTSFVVLTLSRDGYRPPHMGRPISGQEAPVPVSLFSFAYSNRSQTAPSVSLARLGLFGSRPWAQAHGSRTLSSRLRGSQDKSPRSQLVRRPLLAATLLREKSI